MIYEFLLYSLILVIDTNTFSIKSKSDSTVDLIKYTRKNPLKCRVENVKMIGKYDNSCEFYNISLSHQEPFPYCEGQYCTVIPPNDPITNKRYAPRAYSLSSLSKSSKIELCVRKFIKQETNSPGICSSYLINSKIGDVIDISGPFGRLNIRDCLFDQNNQSIYNYNEPNIILIATGTGIGPFRSFYKYLFQPERIKLFNKLLLIYGVRNEACLLYKDELDNLREKYPEKFNLIIAYSRIADKKYVQNAIDDNKNLIKSLVNTNSKIFICGGKAIVTPVKQALKGAVNADLFNQIEDGIKIEVY